MSDKKAGVGGVGAHSSHVEPTCDEVVEQVLDAVLDVAEQITVDLIQGTPHALDILDSTLHPTPAIEAVAPIVKKLNKSKRSSVSNSRYARPSTLIDELAKQVQDYIYFPDPMPLYVTLGVLAANMMKGVPVWLMVVGPSGSGKTLALNMIKGIHGVHSHGVVKGHSAFMSGTGKKDITKNATGGILREFKIVHVDGCEEKPGCGCLPRGLMVFKDFAEILGSDPITLKETLSAFRAVGDGEYERSVGSDGGRKMSWYGRVGFLGACTTEIDNLHGTIQNLGQRWIYYRFDETDGFGESQKSLRNVDREKMDRDLKDLVASFTQMQGLDWDRVEHRDMDHGEENRIIAMVQIIVKCRSRTIRDFRTGQISNIGQAESPQRMVSALGQFYLGLEAIGLDLPYCWKVVTKVAMDSCPALSMAVLKVLLKAGVEGLEIKDVRKQAGFLDSFSKVVIEHTIQDLEMFGVAWIKSGKCGVDSWTAKTWKAGFRGVEL